MDLALEGKTALVTGGSRGIGRAIALALARQGMNVALAARDEAALRSVAAEARAAGAGAHVHACDLREAAEPARFVAAAAQAFGRIDLVVANAGATKRGDFFALGDEDFADGFALKYFAHVRLVRAAWPHLVRGGGSVVHIGGIGGKTPGAEFTVGGSVNAAVTAFAKAMAERGIHDGVRVCVVNPGSIATDRLRTRIQALAAAEGLDEAAAAGAMARRLGIARFGTPEEVAAVVLFLASAPAAYVQGAVLDVDGGATRTI
ncbi:MAG: family oxidoreductase [Myxococcales bacterium]|nr:family oxidoreductase [Myxococcales bacterium]